VAEDAGGLAPGKDDNAVWRKIDRKDGAISHASDYKAARLKLSGLFHISNIFMRCKRY